MNTVYCYTNKINGKKYIGRTSQTLNNRAKKDGRGYEDCSRFWNAICKYGWSNFEATIIAENLSFEESVELEKEFIEKYNTTDDKCGYNILSQESGEGNLSEGTKAKIGEANRGHAYRGTGWHHSDETKQKMSDTQKGKTYPKKEAAIKRLTEAGVFKNNGNNHKFTEEDFKKAKESWMKKVKILETGEIFDSMTECAEKTGISVPYLSRKLKSQKPWKGLTFVCV